MAVRGNQLQPRTKPATQVAVASGFAQLLISPACSRDAYLAFWSAGSWCQPTWGEAR